MGPGHKLRELLLVALALFVCAAVPLAWLYRGLLMSVAVRLLGSRLPNPAKRRGLAISLGDHGESWIRIGLQANLGKTLSQVLGYPVEGAAYSRFGGFNLSRLYSDFLNPDSSYYQAWWGAYVVFDDERRRAFGFDEQDAFVPEEVLAVLEADQRLVYRSAGCPRKFPDGNLVKLRGQLTGEKAEHDGELWWCISGEADTWSTYRRGRNPEASRLRRRAYGVVPSSAEHEVDDYHPLCYRGEFWMRYFPELEATCAKFYICPFYIDRHGREVTKGEQIVPECRELLKNITFTQS
jgi:hypothetical protein